MWISLGENNRGNTHKITAYRDIKEDITVAYFSSKTRTMNEAEYHEMLTAMARHP